MSDAEECRLMIGRLHQHVDEITADVRRFETDHDNALVRRNNEFRHARTESDECEGAPGGKPRMEDIDLRALAELLHAVRPNHAADRSTVGERPAEPDAFGLARLMALQDRISRTIDEYVARIGRELGARVREADIQNVAVDPKSPDAIGLVESDIGELSGLIAKTTGMVVPSFLHDVVPDWGEFERVAKEHEVRCRAYRMMREEISDEWDDRPVRRTNRTESALVGLQSSVTLRRTLAVGFGTIAEVLDVVVWTYVGMITRWIDSFWKVCTASRNLDETVLAYLWALVEALLGTLRQLGDVLGRLARVSREFVMSIARVVERLAGEPGRSEPSPSE